MFIPTDDHGTENWCPAGIQDVMSEGIVVCDVDPQRKDKEETQADDRCNPVMSPGLRIYIKKGSMYYTVNVVTCVWKNEAKFVRYRWFF